MNLEELTKSQLISEVEKLQQYFKSTFEAIFCYEYDPPISVDLPMNKQVEMFYNGILVECNENTARSYGYSNCSDVLGKSLPDLFKAPPGSLDEFFQSFIERGYKTINAEAHEVLEDGSTRYFLNNGHAEIKNGFIHRVWGNFREVTEIKNVEQALMRSEEQYRAIFDFAPIAIATAKLDGEPLTFNRKVPEIMGYPAAEIQKLHSEDLQKIYVNPEDREWFFKELQHKGMVNDWEVLRKKKDGTVYWALVNAQILDQSGDKILQITMQDITERKNSEVALKESELRYRLLVEKSLLGVAILQDRKYVYVNSAFAELTGFSITELLQFSPNEVWLLIHPEDREELEKRNKDLEAETPLVPKHRFRYVRKSGEIRWVESLVTTTAYEGRPALQVFENDITDQINAEKIRKELEHRRDNFITMTTHELRTPLTVISGYLYILDRKIDVMTPEQREKLFKVMKSNFNRLERLVSDVSLLSQFEEDIFKINITKFNFFSFFQKVIEPYTILLGSQLRVKDMQKELNLMIEGDKDRLTQVLENILNNAIDHTSSKNRLVETDFEELSDSIRINITDNGAGIAPENLERIFEQFVSIGTEFSVAGTGVGLYSGPKRRIRSRFNFYYHTSKETKTIMINQR
ncbi:MAG: PAS domain S-box protein [Candidatus Hodarchaeales archaeon]|jgi:PAS domain S-box-containing protein